MKTYFAFEKTLWTATRHVALKLNAFTPHGDAPVLRRGRPGGPDNHRAIAPSVVHDGRRFTMWYTGLALDRHSSLKDHRTVRHSQCIATSDDGIHWTKPKLAAGKSRGSRGSNVLFSGLLLSGVDYLPERHCYAMASSFQNGTHRQGGQTAFAVTTSADGLHWRGLRKAATDIRHFESCAGPKRIGDRYWIVGQSISPYFNLPDGSPCGRLACGYWSEDLVTWTRHPAPLFHYPVHPLYPRSCLQTHLGFTLWPRGRIHLGFVGQLWPACFSENVRFSVGLIYSYDGLNWSEPFEQTPVLGGPGFASWHEGVVQGNSLYNHGDETWFWYAGTDDQGNTWKARSDIGLATVRRDGFAAFEGTGRGPRDLTTSPIPLDRADAALYANAVADPAHPIRIDVLDKAGDRIPGITGLVSANGVRLKTLDLRTVHGRTRTVRFRFRWPESAKQNRLFGFALGPERNTEIGLDL